MTLIEINMEQPTGGLVGTHLWTVKSATHAHSKKGDSMIKMAFRCWAPGYATESEHSCLIMLQGPGFAIGKPRLQALGITSSGTLDLTELIGRKVWIATIEEQDSYQGRDGKMVSTMRLRTDANQLSHKGYQPADNPPAGCNAADYDTDESPF